MVAKVSLTDVSQALPTSVIVPSSFHVRSQFSCLVERNPHRHLAAALLSAVEMSHFETHLMTRNQFESAEQVAAGA